MEVKVIEISISTEKIDSDYDTKYVIDRLKELTVQHYSETLFDKEE